MNTAEHIYEEEIKRRVDEHPYPMLAAALGLGYVLGGGLFTPATLRMGALAIRIAQIPLLRARLFGAVEQTMHHLAAERSNGSAAEDD
ncbi:MAG: hypothetical protein K1X64_20600 [Myxococcaceae bacterium]|nr:hypothetical protein [Myxococcaceae bacterium]